MHCAVIVLSWNGEKYLAACLDALIAQTDGQVELIVVDNASTDASQDIIRRYLPRVRLIANSTNLGFSGGNNIGLTVTEAEVVVLLNQDTEVRPDWLNAILKTFQSDTNIGIVGCKALYSDGRIQHAGASINAVSAFATHIGQGEDDHGQYDEPMDMDYVTGAAFAIHRKVLEQLGGLDEGFNPALYEEVDYCYRARRLGYRVVYQPQAVLVHYESTALPKPHYELYSLLHRNRLRFVLLHWTIDQWLSWMEVEQTAIGKIELLPEVLARSRVYIETALRWPSMGLMRQANPQLGGELSNEQIEQIQAHLLTLWNLARRRISSLLSQAQHYQNNQLFEPSLSQASVKNRLGPNTASWEPDVRSAVPWIGPGIDWFRRVWLNTFVRPYVVPIFQQLMQQQYQLHLRVAATEGAFQALNDETEIVLRHLPVVNDKLSGSSKRPASGDIA